MSSSTTTPAIKTAAVKGRRKLRFATFDDVIKDAEHIVSVPCRTLGNWTVAQNIDHLGKSIQAGFEGPVVKAPWFVRWLIAPVIKPRFLTKGMPAGFALPKEMAHFMPRSDPATELALTNLRVWSHRLQTELPPNGHPAFGNLSHAEWIQLHLRHAELHLSFIVPEQS